MRILFIHTRYRQPGGEDQALQSEIELLKKKGHTIETLLFQNPEATSFMSNLKNGFDSFFNIHSYRSTAKLIKEFKPDVIHLHNLFFKASPSVLYAAYKNNIPVAATIHNYRLICPNALLLRNNKPCELCVHKTFALPGIYHKCYHSSAMATGLVTGITGLHKLINTWKKTIGVYITLTNFAKEKIQNSSLNLAPNQIIVKPNFTKDPGPSKYEREDFFLFAGRLSEEKGIKVLLQAFAEIPNKRLIVVGEGPLKKGLENKFKRNENISFTGKLNNEQTIALMKKCKALIVPSLWYESLPFVIIEAFSTGTPVLASNIGAMLSIITDGYNGLHFKSDDKEELKNTVLTFINNSNHNLMYTNARQTFLNYYTAEKHYTAIMKLYNNLICNHQTKLK